jgi:CRISPR-associated protein Csb1
MNLVDLADHLRRGGAALLSHPATYGVPGGAVIPPARYSGQDAAGRPVSAFVFETRYLDGEFVTTALVDSKQSQSNRSEMGLVEARVEDGPASRIPMLSVEYPSITRLDAELPHRIFDAHIRAATQDGAAVVDTAWYRALRDATPVDLSPLFTTSPVTLGFGGWDSSRKTGQLRIRSHYVSELFGVVASGDDVSRRSGARLDPLGQDFNITPDEFEKLLERQRGHMSDKTVKKLDAELAKVRKAKEGTTISASSLGLGGVPPALETAYGVAVPEVRRARTYSLAGLRRLRFGGTGDEDVAARTALLAMLLLGAAYADADPEIRAYCDIAAPRGHVLLDDGAVDLDLSIDACTAFLHRAIEALPERLAWTGQTMALVGDPALVRGATDDAGDA